MSYLASILLGISFLVAMSSREPDKPLNSSLAKSFPTERSILPKSLKSHQELNQKALEKAYEFYFNHKESQKLSNTYLAIADFSKISSEKRLAIINLKTNEVDFYKVSHGKGSDKDHDLILDSFSDTPGSFATPQGFHKMTETYKGKHGLSLKMQGLEKHNQSSSKRAIVLHGADYVSWDHTGRSQGCPAVESKYTEKIINQLKDGALFYHYK